MAVTLAAYAMTVWVNGKPYTVLAFETQEEANAVFTASNTWQLVKNKKANAFFSEDYLIPKNPGKKNSPYSMCGFISYSLKKSSKQGLVSF